MVGNACCTCTSILYKGSIPAFIKNTQAIGNKCVICDGNFANFYLRDDEVETVKKTFNSVEFNLIIKLPNGGHSITIKSKDHPVYLLLSKYIAQCRDLPYDGVDVRKEISELNQNFTLDADCPANYVRDSITIFKEYLKDILELNSTSDLVSMRTERYKEGVNV